MSRTRYNIQPKQFCTNCVVGKVYIVEPCQSCKAVLCEVCFQFAGCCAEENIIDSFTKKLRVPSIPMRHGEIREHPRSSK